MKQNQIQTQHQQGGEAMKQQQVQQNQQTQTQICFVTFTSKVDKEKAKAVITELRKHFPMKTLIFTPRPPAGRKKIMNVDGILTIITIPYVTDTKQNPTETKSETSGGFKLSDLIKSK